RILANTMSDTYRKLNRAVASERSLADLLDESEARLECWFEEEELSPYEQAERNERVLLLAETLNRLPESQRQAIELRYLKGHSLGEVAGLLDQTEASVA